MKIVCISGSLRKDSFNTAILNNIINNRSEEYKLLDISQMPLFNQDIEYEENKIVENFRKEVEEADYVIIATPEYNYSIPGVLKNAIDWLSRKGHNVLNNKKVAIISASTGIFGGLRSQLHLREVLFCLNAKVVSKPEVYITDASSKIKDGALEKDSMERVNKLIDKLLEEE